MPSRSISGSARLRRKRNCFRETSRIEATMPSRLVTSSTRPTSILREQFRQFRWFSRLLLPTAAIKRASHEREPATAEAPLHVHEHAPSFRRSSKDDKLHILRAAILPVERQHVDRTGGKRNHALHLSANDHLVAGPADRRQDLE